MTRLTRPAAQKLAEFLLDLSRKIQRGSVAKSDEPRLVV